MSVFLHSENSSLSFENVIFLRNSKDLVRMDRMLPYSKVLRRRETWSAWLSPRGSAGSRAGLTHTFHTSEAGLGCDFPSQETKRLRG